MSSLNDWQRRKWTIWSVLQILSIINEITNWSTLFLGGRKYTKRNYPLIKLSLRRVVEKRKSLSYHQRHNFISVFLLGLFIALRTTTCHRLEVSDQNLDFRMTHWNLSLWEVDGTDDEEVPLKITQNENMICEATRHILRLSVRNNKKPKDYRLDFSWGGLRIWSQTQWKQIIIVRRCHFN